MKIMVLDGKHEPRYFDVSDPARLGGACLKIVREHHAMGYYDDVCTDENLDGRYSLDGKQLRAALKGDLDAAIALVKRRSAQSAEYEGVTFEKPEHFELRDGKLCVFPPEGGWRVDEED